MIKKIGIMIILALAINFAMSSFFASAYTIPEQFRPLNEPFSIGKDLNKTNGGNTTTETIVFLQILAGGLLYFAAPLAIILIVMTGFNMAFQGAETEKIEESKRSLTWIALGLLLIILSYSLVRIIINAALGAAAS
ncbi:MAG: hypothetical protein Q8P62_00850 [Candidatus Peregrinibacteria bacterium]|nr:hypothetical protein [Candidatus Peregrinibacteria bacterium]